MRQTPHLIASHAISIRRAKTKPSSSDASHCTDIYNHHTVHSPTTTFQHHPSPQPASPILSILSQTKESDLPFLVAVKHTPRPPPGPRMAIWIDYSHVIGFAYALPHHTPERGPGWDHAVDISLYLDDGVTGRGIGAELLDAMLDALARRKNGDGSQRVREVLAAVPLDPFEGEGASEQQKDAVAFFRKQGFVEAGTLEAGGRIFGKWIDVSIFQKSIVGRLDEEFSGVSPIDDIENDASSEDDDDDEAALERDVRAEPEREELQADDSTSEEGDEPYGDEDAEKDARLVGGDLRGLKRKGAPSDADADVEMSEEGDESYGDGDEDEDSAEFEREKERVEGEGMRRMADLLA